MIKRTLSSLLAVVLTLMFSVGAYASSDLLSGEGITDNLLQKIEYSYFSMADSTQVCYYTDDYFSQSSYVYDQSLSTMTLSLAFSAFGSSAGGEDDYSNKSSNAKDLLLKLGVDEENIAVNEGYTIKPTTDSIGVIAGNMPITLSDGDYTLVAIAVRGAGYGQEWASNFTLGLENQHRGFSEGKEQVLQFLKTYFEAQNISGAVKLWITGYSRGAAVANLVAGAIDDGYVLDDDISYELDDVFAYCFESPAGALIKDVEGKTTYNNIFNVINPNDIVPFVAPADMGFGRYGVDMFIPTAETNPETYEDMKKAMLEFYFSLEGVTTYTVDDFQMKKLGMANWLPGGEPIQFIVDDTKNDYSQNVFLSKYVEILSKEFFIDRPNYVSKYEDQIREICSVVFGCNASQQKILIDSFTAQAQKNWGALAWSYVWNAGINPWGDEADALQMISDWLKIAINDAGITDYDEAVVDSAGIALGDLMLALVTSHPNYFSTAVMNVDKLAEAHYPELCLAWMQSMDTNYSENTVYTLNKNAYRIVYIDGESDVEVLTADETLVAAFENETALELNNTYSFGFDGDTKYVVLPADYEYIVKIDGGDEVDYTVKEYNSSVGITRAVIFGNVSYGDEEYLLGSIPAYSVEEIESGAPNGSSVGYTLINSLTGEIQKDVDVSRGSEFTIEIQSSNENGGETSGDGTYKYGENVVLSAKSKDGFLFNGWYENDTLISKEAELSFNAYENRSFVALFKAVALTPYDGNGVSVINQKVYGMWDRLNLDTAKTLFVDSESLITNAESSIGTGDVLIYNDVEYIVLILGDVDGDGSVSTTDYMRIKSTFAKTYDMEEVYFEAADVDSNGTINTIDYLRIKSYFLDVFDLYENKI